MDTGDSPGASWPYTSRMASLYMGLEPARMCTAQCIAGLSSTSVALQHVYGGAVCDLTNMLGGIRHERGSAYLAYTDSLSAIRLGGSSHCSC